MQALAELAKLVKAFVGEHLEENTAESRRLLERTSARFEPRYAIQPSTSQHVPAELREVLDVLTGS